jgi:hypothetical protein
MIANANGTILAGKSKLLAGGLIRDMQTRNNHEARRLTDALRHFDPISGQLAPRSRRHKYGERGKICPDAFIRQERDESLVFNLIDRRKQ